MNRSSQQKMVARRKDMLELSKSGMKTKEWMQVVASEHGVSFDCVKKDWSKRKFWRGQMIDLKNCNFLIKKSIGDLERYREELEKYAKNCTTESCKLGALKSLCEISFKLIKFYHAYENEEIVERVDKLEKIVENMPEKIKNTNKNLVNSN